jgi:hypothetical protein
MEKVYWRCNKNYGENLMKNNTIIGLDCSTSATGYSVFDRNGLIAYGVIKPKSKDWRERIEELSVKLSEIFMKYRPIRAYIEDVPLKPGNSTILKLGAVQGMVLAVCAQYNCRPNFLLPSDWRGELGLYDGTRQGTHRDVLKQKAVQTVNDEFGVKLKWVAPKSKLNEDDTAEAILIAYSQILKWKNSQNHKT